MEIFRIKKDIPFMRYARVTAFFSSFFFIMALFFLITKGLNFGVDFTGGTLIEVGYPESADIQKIRDSLAANGFQDATVQNFGGTRDALIRLPVRAGLTSAALSEEVMHVLRAQEPKVMQRRVEFVGAQVGKELVDDGGLAMLLVTAGIMIYLAVRFEWRFAVGAIIATAHDVIMVLGLFALFQWEFSLTVLAAVLAILGYSVNDTVVVFDRIRENFRRIRKGSVQEIIDNAVTRTLSRTIMTALATQLMVFAMLLFGGETLYYFSMALTIGIVIGTYSSVFIASPVVMWLGISREDVMLVKKDGAQVDSRP